MSKYIQDFDIVLSKIKSHLPDYLNEKGINTTKNFCCLNPAHNDTNPSMCLITRNEDHPRVHCFSCGFAGDLLDLICLLDDKPTMGLEWIHDTVKPLADKYQIPIQLEDLTEEQVYELDTYRAYRAASSLLVRTDIDTYPIIQQEMVKRGWNEQTLSDNDIGFIPDYVEFRDKLKELGFSAAFLDEIDLSRRDIFNGNNLIFTWKDEFGRPIGFTARNLLYEQQKAEAEQSGKKCTTSKYNNQRTTGLRCNIFQKGGRLYGIDKAIKATPPLYIFEGQADVISMRQAGLINCVALAGSSLSTDHVHLLKKLGINDLCICLDSDSTGQEKQAKILEEKLAGNQEMRVRLVILPEGEDPDSFVRKQGLNSFRQLTHYSAFEWRLGRYPESEDPVTVCKQMIPFIVNESSAIEREVLCKTLARHTGISLKAISDELGSLLNERDHLRSKERQEAIERISYNISKDPGNAEITLREGLTSLVEISKKYDSDVLSAESCLKEIKLNKEKEETIDPDVIGIKLCPDMKPFQDALMGECRDTWGIVGGKENHGKTAVFRKLMYSILSNNPDTICIYHTIDDSRAQLLPGLISIAEGSHLLTMNQIRFPRYFAGLIEQYSYLQDLNQRREVGYNKILDLIQQGRLIIKDATDGISVSFIEALISYHQDKHPDKKLYYFLDNFHKLTDFRHLKDERIRFKTLSGSMKELMVRKHISGFSTAEYTKLPPGIEPNNHSCSETVQLAYDANFIAHIYSELADLPDKYTVCHWDNDWRGDRIAMPRIKVNIGKNKISEVKSTFFMDFWPACSDFRWVDQETVARDQEIMRQERSSKGSPYSK